MTPAAPQPRAVGGRLVTRPLTAPPQLAGPARLRFELFAPILAASLLEAFEQASTALFDEAAAARSPERRRLAFTSATELARRGRSAVERTEATLARFFETPEMLADSWQADVGAFSLAQFAERLEREFERELPRLQVRLHDVPAPTSITAK